MRCAPVCGVLSVFMWLRLVVVLDGWRGACSHAGMRTKKFASGSRVIGTVLVVAVSMGSVTGIAVAETSAPPASLFSNSSPGGMEIGRLVPGSGDRLNELIEKLRSVPVGAPPEQAARIIYPDDPEGQAEYIRLAREVDKGSGSRALPAALAPFVVPLGACVVGGAAGTEIGSLLVSGKHATARGMVEGAVGTCIITLVPPPLRAAANAAKPAIVAAIMAFIIRHSAL